MKFSRWCRVFTKDNISAILNSLTLGIIYLSTEEFQVFKKDLPTGLVDDEIKNAFISEGLLLEDDEDDNSYFYEMRDRLKAEISVELLYLLVTDDCNLKCTYCFEDTPSLNDVFQPTYMNQETVHRSIDFFAEMIKNYGNPEKKKIIHLYGGEPMLNRKAVYDALDYVSELKKRDILPNDCQMAIVTNGILVNEKDAKLFAEHDVIVGLSIDGPALITDFYRKPKKKGLCVTKKIIETFRLLKKYDVNIGLSVTLTPKAIEHFDEFVAFFAEGEFATANGISLNLLHFTPNIELTDDHYRQAVECQIKAFQRFREIGLYEERIMRKAQCFISQEPMYADCGVVGHQLVISPDGRIGVCQDFIKPRKYFPCSVYDQSYHGLLKKLFAKWRCRSPFFMPECIDCSAIAICGGGCPASAEVKTGNRYNLDKRACMHSKLVLEWLIWDVYDKM